MFFDDWHGLVRVVVVGVPAYGALVALLRVSGKRTLSKLNAFDLVVTVALGSTLASIITSEGVALVEGVAAMLLLIALQYALAWASVRSPAVDRLVKSEPSLLLFRGQMLRGAMRRERVSEGAILTALREGKLMRISDAEAVVLESDGSLTVMPRQEPGAGPADSTLRSVGRPGPTTDDAGG